MSCASQLFYLCITIVLFKVAVLVGGGSVINGLPRLVSRRYTINPGIAAAGAAAVQRCVLLAGQKDQQPGPQAGIYAHGPQNNQQDK